MTTHGLVDESLSEAERLADAARPLLVAVEELVDAVVGVAEQTEGWHACRGDEHQLVHTRRQGLRWRTCITQS